MDVVFIFATLLLLKKKKFGTKSTTVSHPFFYLSVHLMENNVNDKSEALPLDNAPTETEDYPINITENTDISKTAPSIMRILSFETSKDDDQKLDNIDFKELAYKAAREFQNLNSEKNELVREKEKYKQKHDDLTTKMEELQQHLNDSEVYKEENQTLLNQNANYESEIKIFEQEKAILQETIQDLKHQMEVDTKPQTETETMETVNLISTQEKKPVKHDNVAENEQRFMVEIQRMTQEKNELMEQLETYRVELNNKNKTVAAINQKLKSSQTEAKRLSDNLTEQQNKYIKLEQSKNEQKNIYDRKLTLHSDQIEDEQQAKEIQFMKTIQDLKKKVQELEEQNAELQNDTNKSDSHRRRNHLRMRTKNDVLDANDLYDLDPFGGIDDQNDDELFEEDEKHNSDDDGPVIETFQEGANDIDIKSAQNADHNDKNENEEVNISTQCNCLISFFNKFKKVKPNVVQNEYQKMD
eukprot:337272_1